MSFDFTSFLIGVLVTAAFIMLLFRLERRKY